MRWHAKYFRNVCTPDIALALTEMWWETDVRGVLPAVQAPALLLVGEGEGEEPRNCRARRLADARCPTRPTPAEAGRSHETRSTGTFVRSSHAIRRFVGIDPERAHLDTILSTVLMTDIVGSDRATGAAGRPRVEGAHRGPTTESCANALDDWRGVENDTAGDGFFATFDGPARAIHCALEIRDRVGDSESSSGRACTRVSAR